MILDILDTKQVLNNLSLVFPVRLSDMNLSKSLLFLQPSNPQKRSYISFEHRGHKFVTQNK